MAKQNKKDKYPAYWHRNWYTDENGSYSVEGLNHLTQDEIQNAYNTGMGEAGPETSDSYQRIIRQLPNKTLDTTLVKVLYPETSQTIDNNSPEGKELNEAFDARKTKAGYRQDGGEIPSNDQQQLFISIITDMAQVLGVEPSQELAEAVLTAFENNDDSEGLLTLFTQIKDKHMQDTGLFKQGGKISTFVQKFKCGGKKTKVKKAALGDQIGDKISKVSRSTMFDDAEEFMPEADRKFVRNAYKTAKNHGKNLGLTGRGLRNWAKGQVSDRFRAYADEPIAQQAQQLPQLPVLSDDIVIEDEPIVFDDSFKSIDFSTPVVKRMETRPKWTATNASVGQGANTYTVQRGNTLGQIVADYNKNNSGANLRWQDVAAWNGISDPSKMQVGQVINFTNPNTNTNTNSEDAYWAPDGYQVVSRQDGSLGMVRNPNTPSASTTAPQAKPKKKNSWFANATMAAAMADAPAVMTASGWRQNEAGDYVQDREDDPGVARLRNNLAVLGGVAQGVTGAGLLTSATGAGTGTLAIAGPTMEAPASTPLLTGPAAKHFLYDAAGKLVMAYKRGGYVEKAEDGTKVGATYQIKKGDSLIKIARQFGLNSLDEILALNPQIKNPNMIREGQILNLPKDKMKQNGKVEAAAVSAEMPNYDRVDYANLPASVKTKVDAYAQAIRDHKMKVSDVPVLYRQQAYNQSIRNVTDEAAPLVATKVMMAPWTIPDTVIRGGLNEARKAINGKDDTGDYDTRDYFDGNFSWLGKEYQEEHPIADAAINMVTTPVVMVGAENLAARAMDGTLKGTMARASANAKATARTMGVQPEPVTVEYTMGKTGGHSYKGPGAGKAHTRGSVNNASYRQVPVSSKVVDPMQFVENPAASGFTGTGYWHGFPAVLPEQERPNYVIAEPEKEYTEETIVSKNPWIYNTETPSIVVPYEAGNETITYVKGQANRGKSPIEQVITQESIETGKGNPKSGVKVKKGEAEGSTPSGYYSGYGYMYGLEGGPWLKYQRKGGTIKKCKKK